MFFSRDIYDRNQSIVAMKCLAALLITISHCDGLFPASFRFLTSGGALGDAFFFFCSGFALFLGRVDRFDNWYKRKVARIYIPFIVWVAFTDLVGWHAWDMCDVIFTRDYWFLRTIMVYYALFYLIRCQYVSAKNALLVYGVVLILYSFRFDASNFLMYGTVAFLQVCFFGIMLLGAGVGRNQGQIERWSLLKSLFGVVASVIVFYAVMIPAVLHMGGGLGRWQIGSLIPLGMASYSMYQLCGTALVRKFLMVKGVYSVMYLVSSLTLEIYICNMAIDHAPRIFFPLNVLCAFGIVLVGAIVLKIATNLVEEIFSREPIRWNRVIIVD